MVNLSYKFLRPGGYDRTVQFSPDCLVTQYVVSIVAKYPFAVRFLITQVIEILAELVNTALSVYVVIPIGNDLSRHPVIPAHRYGYRMQYGRKALHCAGLTDSA